VECLYLKSITQQVATFTWRLWYSFCFQKPCSQWWFQFSPHGVWRSCLSNINGKILVVIMEKYDYVVSHSSTIRQCRFVWCGTAYFQIPYFLYVQGRPPTIPLAATTL